MAELSPFVVVDAAGTTMPRYVDDKDNPSKERLPDGKELGWTSPFGYVYFDIVAAPVKDYPHYEENPPKHGYSSLVAFKR
jgi:hypothetical protein